MCFCLYYEATVEIIGTSISVKSQESPGGFGKSDRNFAENLPVFEKSANYVLQLAIS